MVLFYGLSLGTSSLNQLVDIGLLAAPTRVE